MEDFNYYEYVSHIEIIQIHETKNNSENRSAKIDDNNTADTSITYLSGAGRPSSSKFSFLKNFPMAAQRLRAKSLVPTFAGMRPARHPGIYKENEHWRKLALGKFYTTIFIPWSITHIINNTYENLSDWAKHTEKKFTQK